MLFHAMYTCIGYNDIFGNRSYHHRRPKFQVSDNMRGYLYIWGSLFVSLVTRRDSDHSILRRSLHLIVGKKWCLALFSQFEVIEALPADISDRTSDPMRKLVGDEYHIAGRNPLIHLLHKTVKSGTLHDLISKHPFCYS